MSITAVGTRVGEDPGISLSPRRTNQQDTHVVLTDRGRPRLARADIRGARTAGESRLLAQLVSAPGAERATERLRQLTGDAMTDAPDYVAVRTGSGVTPLFSGGGAVWGITYDETKIVFFGTGDAAGAAKGVAISFGADTASADRATLTRWAMSWLEDHLDDARTADGGWNRSLIDATA